MFFHLNNMPLPFFSFFSWWCLLILGHFLHCCELTERSDVFDFSNNNQKLLLANDFFTPQCHPWKASSALCSSPSYFNVLFFSAFAWSSNLFSCWCFSCLILLNNVTHLLIFLITSNLMQLILLNLTWFFSCQFL